MKIVHICITEPYVDGWGYQSNLLPQYLQKQGIQNYIVTSANNFPCYLKKEEAEKIMAKGKSYEIDGVIVKRIKTLKITHALLLCHGLSKVLEEVKPDAIFHHNFNCTTFPIAARYAKKARIPLVLDNHADTINMTSHKLWVWLYYKFLIRNSCRLYKNQIYKAYGVTHARCEFIHDYFGVREEKIDFLPIGADVDLADKIYPKEMLREMYDIREDDFVIVSGGKMGKYKGTDFLIHAVDELVSSRVNLRLVLFGSFEDEETVTLARESANVTYMGWCDRTKTLQLLKMADVACWPIHHTTLIEDAVSVCTPVINRKTKTSEHLIDGNGIWLKKGTKDEIKSALIQMLDQTKVQKQNMQTACIKMREAISYRTVAKKLLEDLSQ